jgi:rod shape-determining protein MreB
MQNAGGIDMAKHDLGIDLGTATFVVYKRGEGIIIQEPSMVAINKRKGQILAIGAAAKEMIGKTPEEISIVKPIQDGVISDPDVIEEVLRYFIKKAKETFALSKPNLVIGIPALTTDVERRAVVDAAERVGAARADLVIEPLAAAIGSGIDIVKPDGNMIIDMGGGTTDIVVISLGGIVVSDSIKLAGQAMDAEIIKYVKRVYRFLIGESTAEQIKIKIGKAYEKEENIEMEVKGQDLKTGLPSSIKLNSEDVFKAIKEILDELISHIRMVLEKTPPELASDILKNGIILTGGTALTRGIDKFIEEKTCVKTRITDEPHLTVAKGTGILLDDIELLSRVSVDY